MELEDASPEDLELFAVDGVALLLLAVLGDALLPSSRRSLLELLAVLGDASLLLLLAVLGVALLLLAVELVEDEEE